MKRFKRAHSLPKGSNQRKNQVDPAVRQCAVAISFMSISELSAKSGLSYSCTRNLVRGITKRPQHRTIVGLYKAGGFDVVVKRRED